MGKAAPGAAEKGGCDAETTPKRRRAGMQSQGAEREVEDTDDDEDVVVDRQVKRAKLATGGKPKTKPKPKHGFKARARTETVDGADDLEPIPAIKNEEVDEPHSAFTSGFETDSTSQVFVDAAETLDFDEWV